MAKQQQDIHEIVSELCREAHRERQAPIGIKFSTEGYIRARSNTVPGMDPWGGCQNEPTCYLGFPFKVIPGQLCEVELDTVHGASAEARAFRSARNATYGKPTPGPSSVAIRFSMDSTDPRIATAHVLGKHLTRAQLSDIINAWVEAHPNEQPVTDMLVDWVQTHGRFE